MKTTAWKQIRKFLSDEEGATAVEYGIMVALIAAVIIVGALSFLPVLSLGPLVEHLILG